MRVNLRATDVVVAGEHVLGRLRDALDPRHVADRPFRAAFAAGTVVANDVDEQRVVEHAHLGERGAQTADLRIGMREESGVGFHVALRQPALRGRQRVPGRQRRRPRRERGVGRYHAKGFLARE